MTGRAQTIVCTAAEAPQRKQQGARRTKLLPNSVQKQQDFATKSTLVGYARVSKTEGQDLTPQLDALDAAGCRRIYEEKASGGRWDRPELKRLLDHLSRGNVLVVWKLDRLSRSLRDLLVILDRLEAIGAGFRSLTEAIDTTGPAGRMMMQMLGAFAEFERAMLRERTRAGLQSAQAQGRRGGRKPRFSEAQKAEILTMLTAGRAASDIARLFGVHRATISRLNIASRHATPA
jgi:DNA invertase Pin-like site-specific DNA recombinase